MCDELEKWLLSQGGPAIKLRIAALNASNGSLRDANDAVSDLLAIDEVRSLLSYLDAFQTSSRDKKTLEHLIHYYRDTCLANYFPLLMDLGFKAGIPEFDEKMAPVLDIFKFLIAFSNEYNYCYTYSLLLHRFFFISGCLCTEVVKSMENRLNAIHKAAKEKIFEIYQDESNLPKKPEAWAERGVLKDELNPFKSSAEKPLPNVYDLWALAYYIDICDDLDKIKKINDIVSYILDPEFQKIREGYGVIWVKDRRIYHACGWSPTLPLYQIEGRHTQAVPYPVIDYLDFMSHFKVVHQSKWFSDCLSHFEQFRTDKGTYLFPKEYLHKKYIDKAFISEENLSLKRTERDLIKREVVSTMKMVEIYRRLM